MALALMCLLLATGARAEEAVTLDRAVAVALAQGPRVAALRAALGEAEARVVAAGVYRYNPEIEVSGAARLGGGEAAADFEVALGQTFELGGQRGQRVAAARAERAAARAEAARAAQLVAADVQLAFVEALAARERLAVAEAEQALATTLAELAQKRLDAGAGTQLEVNVAVADRGRVELRAADAAGDYAAARVALAQAMGLAAPAMPAPAGELVEPGEAAPALETLLAEAEGRRVDLAAFAAQAGAAEARLAAARAAVWPSIGVRVFGGREEGSDTLVGGGITLPLPVFDRQQGEIGEAIAAARRVEAEAAAARLDALHGVVAAHGRYAAASAVARRLRESVLGTLRESLTLIEKSFAAGQATWIEVLVTRTALFDAQRALIDAAASARRARVLLDVAAGRVALPDGVLGAEGER
ncbi:MAG: TolC family protein [Myxococcales bacterium]|nr:TolC family protein [Myxococcales bacterium]